MAIKIEAGSTDTDKPLLLHRSVFDDGTVTVSDETSDGPGLNCMEDSTFDFWDTSAATSTIQVDVGWAGVWCDCVGIEAHTLGTDGATVEVQYSSDAVSWTTILTSTPTDNTCIIGVFPITKKRYWRVRVTDGPSLIGVLKLGRRVIIPTGVLSGHVAINNSSRIEGLSNKSITGQFLGDRIIRTGAETTIDFGLLYTNFVDDYLTDFKTDYNDLRTFFYAGAPSVYPLDLGYCKRPSGGSELRPSYDEGGLMMGISFDVDVFTDSTSGRL